MIDKTVNIRGMTGKELTGKDENGKLEHYAVTEATRFEIIGDGGIQRVFTLEPGAIISIQDSGKTVKLFTGAHVAPVTWFEPMH